MPYTDRQIEDMARQMKEAGGTDWDISQFVELARKEQKEADSAEKLPPPTSPQQTEQDAVKVAQDVAKRTLGIGADMALEGGGAAIGQAAGMAGGPFAPVTVPIGGFLGGMGGNIAAQKRRGNQDIKWGEAIGSGVAGLVPGMNLVKAGAGTVLREGIKYGAANYAGKATETMIDEKRAPTPLESAVAVGGGMLGAKIASIGGKTKSMEEEVQRSIDNAVRDRNVKDMIAAGYLVDPALANPDSSLNRLADRIAGASQVQRAAVHKNQIVTDHLAKAEIGLPKDALLTDMVLNDHIHKISEPYREIEKISPLAKTVLEKLRDARAEEVAAWKQYSNFSNPRAGTPALEKEARSWGKKVDSLETALDKIVSKAGNPELYNDYVAARRLVAKANVVKSAITADGHISAPTIGKIWDRDTRNLTGNLELIARADGTMPQVMREAAVTQAPGSQSFRPFLAAAAGTYGYQKAGPVGAAAGAAAVALGDIPVRKTMLTPTYQQFMAVPRYNETNPGLQASLLRFSSQAATR